MPVANDSLGQYLVILSKASAEKSSYDTTQGGVSIPTYLYGSEGQNGRPNSVGTMIPAQISGSGGYTPPRYIAPVVVSSGAGVKTKCHFEETTEREYVDESGVIQYQTTKDETGRLWDAVHSIDGGSSWNSFGNHSHISGVQAAHAGGKFGANASLASPGSFKVSSDFDFGSGDFCIASWNQIKSVFWRQMGSNSFRSMIMYRLWEEEGDNNEYNEHGTHWAALYSPRVDYDEFDQEIIYPTFLHWEVGEGKAIIWNDIPQSLFDDEYHMFVFSRHGDVFTIFVDGQIKAQETFAGHVMPYYFGDWMEFWNKVFQAV